jgi:hypothetical protein
MAEEPPRKRLLYEGYVEMYRVEACPLCKRPLAGEVGVVCNGHEAGLVPPEVALLHEWYSASYAQQQFLNAFESQVHRVITDLYVQLMVEPISCDKVVTAVVEAFNKGIEQDEASNKLLAEERAKYGPVFKGSVQEIQEDRTERARVEVRDKFNIAIQRMLKDPMS